MHVLSSVDHVSAKALPRAVALVGQSPLVLAAERMWCARLDPRVVRMGEEEHALAALPLDTPRPVLLRDGLRHLTKADVPRLTALTKTTVVVATGEAWGDQEVKEWWAKKNGSIRRIYDSTRTSTPATRTLVERWLVAETGMVLGVSRYVCRELNYDERAVAEFVARARFFSGPGLTSSGADVLMLDLRQDDLVEAVLTFRMHDAVRQARSAPTGVVQAVFSALPARIVALARMYPVVMRHPRPNGEASKEARVPLPTLTRYWSVAARYSPPETVYRLGLVSALSEASPRDFSALVTLTALW